MDEQRTANQEPDPERPRDRSVDGLGCMALRSPDIDFYSGLLGARVAARLRLTSGPRLYVLDVGSETALHLYEDQPRRPKCRATDCGHHFGFRVSDEEELGGFVSRLHRLGLRSASVDDAGPWWRVEFDDPDGNRVSAACFKPSLSLLDWRATGFRPRRSGRDARLTKPTLPPTSEKFQRDNKEN